MKIHKVTAALLVVFGYSLAGSAVTPKNGSHTAGASGPKASRVTTVAQTEQAIPEKYGALVDSLKEVEEGKPVVGFCGTEYLIDNGGAEKLQKHFETLSKYRTSLNDCGDKASEKLKGFLDAYTDKMRVVAKGDGKDESLGSIAKQSKTIQGMDSALRFHEAIKEFLAKKESDQASQKEKFAEADAALKKAIDGIFRWCQKPGKDFVPSKDAKTTHDIEEFQSQIAKLNLAKEEACELNPPAAPVPDDSQRVAGGRDGKNGKETASEDGQESSKPEVRPAPPTQDPRVAQDATPTQPSQPGATGPAVITPPVVGGATFPQGDASIVDPALANLNGFEREDALLRQIQQLAAQAGQPNRIGGSPDNSRSFQFPPVSVQPGQQYPQQQQPQQPYPMQQMPQFPYGAMMQQPVPTPIPAELLNPSRNESVQRTSPNDAAQTQALLEMAKLQQQLMQTQMANQMGYGGPMGGGTANINRLMNSRTAFRGAGGSRFMNRGSRRMARSIGSVVR